MTYLEPIASAAAADSWIGFGIDEPAATVRLGADPNSAYARVRSILSARRSRGQYFDEALFADPVWDMLLELYAARLGQFNLSISSLCIGAAVPPTTALRWINTMEERGLVERWPDPRDKRRVFVSLSDKAEVGMKQMLERTETFI